MTGKYDTKELNGINCAIVEEGISAQRADFIKKLLEHNGYTVVKAENSPPKALEGESLAFSEPVFTVGVTDITFNVSLALYNRHLKTLENQVLLPHYWVTGKKGEEWYWKEAIGDRG